MPSVTFEDEYIYARGKILQAINDNKIYWMTLLNRSGVGYGDGVTPRLLRAVMNLPLVLQADGFDAAQESVLETFRTALADAARGKTEGEVILALLGWDATLPINIKHKIIKQAAAIKLFRHCYRIQQAGARIVWVVSQPASYTQFTVDEILANGNSRIMLEQKLSDTNEFFDATERANLLQATIRTRRWCDHALTCLWRARAENADERARVVKWFADPTVPKAIVDMMITTLQRGYTQLRNRIDENRLIYVDKPTKRTDVGTVAFVHPTEAMRSIYIHRAFFAAPPPELRQQTYQAVTILHELSHRVLKTDDHKYDHERLGVRASFHIGQAIDNADTWAYFAADCAGEINGGQGDWLRIGTPCAAHHHP